MLLLIPDSASEAAQLVAWTSRHADHAFVLAESKGIGASFAALGPRAEACREPINVHSASSDPQIRLIANFAPTPFELDSVHYACVEAFWQSLRFSPHERERVAAMDGTTAKRAAHERPYGSHVHYRGKAIAVGAFAHWQLMRRACRAKFEQNAPARAALLATGERPLVHRVRPDSRTIPGVVMAEIWMALRRRLRRHTARETISSAPQLPYT